MPWPERPTAPAGGRVTAELLDAMNDQIELLSSDECFLDNDHSGMSSSTTRVSTNLSIPVLASMSYIAMGRIVYQAGSGGRINVGISAPTGTTFKRAWLFSPPATVVWSSGNISPQMFVGTDTSPTVFNGPGGNSSSDIMQCTYVVVFKTSTTAGNAIFQYAQAISNGTLTQVKAGSTWCVKRVLAV